jgi:RHS repeat-associated protein
MAPVWYNTETNFFFHNTLRSGDDNQVAKSARQIEGPDGIPKWVMTEQSSTPQGLPDISVDELGRMVKRTYSSPPNAQVTPDLLAVQFYDGAAWKPLFTLSGYVNHQPRTITHASGLRQDVTFNTTEQPTLIKVSRNTDATTTSRIRATYDTFRDGGLPAWPGTPGLLRRIEKAAVPTGTSDAAQQWMVTDEYTYDTMDRVHTHTDATGYTLTFDYDNLDRITLVTHPDSTTEQFSYQRGLGAPVSQIKALDLTAYKDRAGRWTRMAYNTIRQPELLLTPDGKTLQYAWCRCGSLWKLTDPMGRVTEWKRDILGRVTEKVRADGTTKTLYTYEPLSGLLKTVQPPDRGKVTYSYNLDGSLYKESYDDEGLTPNVTYHYTTAINGTTFDPLGRLRFIQDGIGTTTLTYNDAAVATVGQHQVSVVDGPFANDRLHMTFDNRDRVSDRDVRANAGTVTRSETYTWDGLDRLKTVVNTLGPFTFNYTGAEERVASITRPNSLVSAFTYYQPGMSDSVTGQPLTNVEGRRWTITHTRTTTQYSKHIYGYDKAARLTSWREEASGNPAPVANIFGYNSSDELTAQTSRWHPNGSVLEQGQWAYDDAGNIIAAGDATTMTTRTHDLKLNRLTRIGGAGRISVEGNSSAYSAVTVRVGNGPVKQAVIVSDPAGGYRFQAEVDVLQGNNFITVTATALDPFTGQPDTTYPQVVTQQYHHQAAGISRNYTSSASRLLEEKNATFTTLRKFDYDAKNRLKKVTVSGTVTEWDYDYADRRVREWQYLEGGSKPAWPAKLYIWDGTKLVQERVCTSAATYNAGGTITRTHYYGGFNDGVALNGTKYQTTTDHLGNVRDVINASGTLVARYDYNAWGKPTKVSGTTVNASLLINSRYYHHAASGLHLALYRAYDPDLGRWLSEDPLEEEGGLNLYGYVGNSPLMAVDPLGLVDMSLTCPTGNSASLHEWEKTYDDPDYYDLAGHGVDGNRDGSVDGVRDENTGAYVSVPDLAKRIVDDPKYKPGTAVKLIVCKAGGGKDSVGSRLAEALKKLTKKDTKVKAPTRPVGPKVRRGVIVPGSKPGGGLFNRWRTFP